MSGKDKDNTLSKFKQFFNRTKHSGVRGERIDFTLSAEKEKELQPETPVAIRCRALKDLGEEVRTNRLEDATIKKLCILTKDLIVPNKPAEQRQTVLLFYQKLIQGQFENLTIMREYFFRIVQDHDVPEDIIYRLELLKTLTDHGKNITSFEERIGAFMLSWLPAIVEAQITAPFLEVIVNIIKFNAAYLETGVVNGIIQHTCFLCASFEDTRTVMLCLQVLDTALCYSVFPRDTLALCIVTLCRTVNREAYCQESWKIMKNLLGTNLGYTALKMMIDILNDEKLYEDEALLRGAVFHINMGLWGNSPTVTPELRCPISTVLSSFLHALSSRRIIVTYEVNLSIQRLIKLNGTKITEASWDIICEILAVISENLIYYEQTSALPKDHVVQNVFHETLNQIEIMLQRYEVAINPDHFYGLIERVCDSRSELSVLHLIDYVALKIQATKPEWLLAMYRFMERFYRMKNVNIRVKAVHTLMQFMEINRAAYEEEILERVVIPHFITIHQETEISIRVAVGKLLIEFVSHCETKRCLELLDIIEKLLNRPLDLYETTKLILHNETDYEDVIILVDGLIEVFLKKLYRLPSTHAIKIFHLLIGLLESLYQTPALLQGTGKIRYKIFNWMMRARANKCQQIGFPDLNNNNKIRFSHYLGLDIHHHHHTTGYRQQDVLQAVQQQQQQQQQQQNQQNQPQQQQQNQQQQVTGGQQMSDNIPAATLSTISIRRGCQRIVECLKIDRDWNIIQLVLRELTNVLQNKALLQGNDMDSLANTLINLYLNKNFMDTLQSPPDRKPNQSDFHALILTTIASLVPYHHLLTTTTLKEMTECLRHGLFLRNPRCCVHALNVMLLEMPELMLRHLPEVLLEMSKMSTTVHVAVPVLEFLSTLNRLPSRRFANFVVVQYMYVFAITVPYTNPYKYDHYTVSLAHHVIAGWFLKCRLPLRRNFVNYIIKGFETNVQIPFQETKKMDFSSINEDSSNRKRSSSLTEQGSRRRDHSSSIQRMQPTAATNTTAAATAAAASGGHGSAATTASTKQQEDNLYNFHMELAETCIDFLARHTFSPCSALPKRLPTSDFILTGGQSMNWLIGHNLITITTSGCTSMQLKNGLCDRCSLFCKTPQNIGQQHHQQQSSPHLMSGGLQHRTISGGGGGISPGIGPISPETLSSDSYKRYTKATLQHSSQESGSTDITSSTSSSTIPTPYSHQTSDSGGSSSVATGGGGGGAGVSGGKFFRQTSTDGRFSSSSGSLEALSRRGSIPDTPDNFDGNTSSGIGGGVGGTSRQQQHHNSGGMRLQPQSSATSLAINNNNSSNQQQQQQQMLERSKQICACSCTGWAEICIRRPTGNMSWVMRIQNQITFDTQGNEFPLHDIISLFMPSLGGVFGQEFHSDINVNLNPTTVTPAASSILLTNLSAGGNSHIQSSTETLNMEKNKISNENISVISKICEKSDDDDNNLLVVEGNVVGGTASNVGIVGQSSSGPIDIPKQTQPQKESAGSFSDIETERGDYDYDDDDGGNSRGTGDGGGVGGGGGCGAGVGEDGTFDDSDESRSRNPVRRVNSSPEMSSNWRNPFLNQKSTATSLANAVPGMVNVIGTTAGIVTTAGSGGGSVSGGGGGGVGPVGVTNCTPAGHHQQDDDLIATSTIEMEQQQKKKTFGKDMRVSCEAIPEEIAGSTPPSQPDSVKDGGDLMLIKPEMTVAVVASAAIHIQQQQRSTINTAVSSILSSSTFVPIHPERSSETSGPKKQLSADDATNTNTKSTTIATEPQIIQSIKNVQPKLKLPMTEMLPKVTTKPPHSPTPLSPRLLAKNAANKIASFAPSVSGGGGGGGGGGGSGGSSMNTSSGGMGVGYGGGGNGGITVASGGGTSSISNNQSSSDMIRGRSKTISVVREHDNRESLKWTFRGARSGISPSAVFLQLYHTGPNVTNEQPIQIGPSNLKAITLLDLIPPFETHKIGVIYVGPRQTNETEIFKNRFGSTRYCRFLQNLGTLVALRDAKENHIFHNMDQNGRDGNYTYIWQDDIVQVTFHVATLMPNKDTDPHCYEIKKHIGNDFVTIVYNESGEEYNINTIKGQFNYASVIVEPLELQSNRIFVRAKDDVSKYVSHCEPKILSDNSAPLFARQLALHANLASLVAQSLKTKNQSPYASNWLERLRKIKHLRAKLLRENNGGAGGGGGGGSGSGSGSANQAGGGGGGGGSGSDNQNLNGGNGGGGSSPWLKEDFTTYTQ